MTEQISELMSNEITFDPLSGFMNVDIEFRERVTRCRDCAHCKPTTDGRRYCSLWSHIVPPEGYCWRGDYGDIADIE